MFSTKPIGEVVTDDDGKEKPYAAKNYDFRKGGLKAFDDLGTGRYIAAKAKKII